MSLRFAANASKTTTNKINDRKWANEYHTKSNNICYCIALKLGSIFKSYA